MAQTLFEEINVTGKDLLKRIKKLIKEGNVRRLIIKNKKGDKLLEMPLTMGAASLGGMMILTPFLSAISFIALMVTEATILVERDAKVDPNEVEVDDIEIVEE
jgi:hypothetical protein